MNESLSGCDKLIGNVQGMMVIYIYLIGHSPACSDGPMCGHQPAAVRDEMHREPCVITAALLFKDGVSTTIHTPGPSQLHCENEGRI